MDIPSFRRPWRRSVWSLGALLVLLARAEAVQRQLKVQTPDSAVAGQPVTVRVFAVTQADDGETIGFLHVDVSVDSGRTWKPYAYLAKAGRIAESLICPVAGEAGSTVLVRARVAFRDGLAGDVDYRGDPILWEKTWAEWREPQAKIVRIPVTGP